MMISSLRHGTRQEEDTRRRTEDSNIYLLPIYLRKESVRPPWIPVHGTKWTKVDDGNVGNKGPSEGDRSLIWAN